ncbi:hypothetical protein BVRB_2g044420, partial [Beta vulgaris subsp. vulgaris]
MREFHSLDMPGTRTVVLWSRLRRWLRKAKNLCSLAEIKEYGLDSLDDEIQLLEKELTQYDQEIGFCHNDLQYGNIMMDEETKSVTLIDYEYASYNPVAYDLLYYNWHYADAMYNLGVAYGEMLKFDM